MAYLAVIQRSLLPAATAPVRIGNYLSVLRQIYGSSLPASFLSWVDIGCGHGKFLDTLQSFGGGGLSLFSLELDVHKGAGCVSRGLAVHPCALQGRPGKFSAFSILSVFSHLQDPKIFLRDCGDRL